MRACARPATNKCNQSVITYDEAKVGKCIAWIGEHFVYEYGGDQVIKFSKFDAIVGLECARRRNEMYLKQFRTYLGQYFLTTELALSANGRRLASIQPRITGRRLQRRDLIHAKVRTQCADLLQRYQQMIDNGLPYFDLMGNEGLLYGGLGNVFVTNTGDLLTFDAMTFEVADFPRWIRPFLYTLLAFGRRVQDRRIAQFQKLLS
jgi:hypothetical protein